MTENILQNNYETYMVVKNPKDGKTYYYISDKDEDDNPIYSSGIYEKKTIQYGIQSYVTFHTINGQHIHGSIYKKN